jgi:phosphate transport system substrate-binding protein
MVDVWKRFRIMMCMVLLLVHFVGCSRLNAPDHIATGEQVKILLSGSSTVGPLVQEIGKRYEKLNPGVRVDVQTGGSSRGIAEAKSGLADIGMSSRALKESEIEGRMQWPIATDGVCFIVHADNPVPQISESQLVGIMRGEIDNWNQLGGDDRPIFFINRAAGRSELELVNDYFGIDPADMKASLVAGENQQGIKLVATTPDSISYMSVGASEEAIAFSTPIRMLPLAGVAATSGTVETGEFPLSRPLILVTGSQPRQEVQKFIQFAQSKEVADLVRELSYVPISN